MQYTGFRDLIKRCQEKKDQKRVAVAGAAEEHVLNAALKAFDEGIAVPVLIGNRETIQNMLAEAGRDPNAFNIVHADGNTECGTAAVGCIKDGTADFLMKGNIETRDILKPLVAKENGLNLGRTMNVFSYNEVPQMQNMLALADGGMIPYPTLEQKRDIILNCVDALHKLGIEDPSVAVLAGVEKVNPKLPETVDAAELVRMNRDGEIPGCKVFGPISFDIAFSREIAERKGYDCPYAGSFDCVIVPSMTAGNLMHKAMILHGGTKMAGVIVGAKVPVVLSSRGASTEEKFASLSLASLLSDQDMNA